MPNSKPIGIAYSDPDLTQLNLNGTAVTSDAGELNLLDGVTATTTELNTLAGLIASVSMTSTPASGTCAVQFTFKNAAGVAISSARRIHYYISDSAGVPSTAVTSFATLTNGTVDTAATGVAGKWGWANTTAAGLLGVTLTASAGTYYMSFMLPNGRIITSGAIVVN